MHFISNFNLTKNSYFSLLFSLIPISFIAGNMIININILLLILSVFLVFGKSPFKVKYFLLDKIIFLFFFLILFTGAYNDIELFIIKREYSDWRGGTETLHNSVLFFQYLIVYVSLRFLLVKNI